MDIWGSVKDSYLKAMQEPKENKRGVDMDNGSPELRGVGLSTSDDFADVTKEGDCVKQKRKRITRLILCLVSIFMLSLLVGILVSEFMGPGGIVAGLIIGSAIGVVIDIFPLFVHILTNR